MVADAVQRLGSLHILVNSGSPPGGSATATGPIESVVDEDLLHDFNVKYVGALRCARAVIPHMKQQQSGRIINLSSFVSMSGGRGAVLPYAAAKGAVNTFTKGLASELGEYKITVNAVAPGIILTAFHDKFSHPERLQEVIAATPLRRAGTPEEVAELIAYLASDEAGFITGEVFSIDGGR
jgi:3-oxoacyl-[acyl-carrier protein] reductase